MEFDHPYLLDFAPDASVNDMAEALKRIMGRLGCTACGRLSVHIRAIDDPVMNELSEIGSLRSAFAINPAVSFNAGVAH